MKHYLSARKLSVNEKKHVTELISVKANNKHIRDLVVRKYGKLITLKGIHKLKSQVRKKNMKWFEGWPVCIGKVTGALEKDNGAFGGVIVDEDDFVL